MSEEMEDSDKKKILAVNAAIDTFEVAMTTLVKKLNFPEEGSINKLINTCCGFAKSLQLGPETYLKVIKRVEEEVESHAVQEGDNRIFSKGLRERLKKFEDLTPKEALGNIAFYETLLDHAEVDERKDLLSRIKQEALSMCDFYETLLDHAEVDERKDLLSRIKQEALSMCDFYETLLDHAEVDEETKKRNILSRREK